MGILVRNLQRRQRLNSRLLKRIGSRTLASLGCENAEVSLLLVTDARIATLNTLYRGDPTPTDVLSFPLGEGFFPHLHPTLLGDVVISVETAARQARGGGRSLEEETARLLIHGLLHLTGYDHAERREAREMFRLQRRLLTAARRLLP